MRGKTWAAISFALLLVGMIVGAQGVMWRDSHPPQAVSVDFPATSHEIAAATMIRIGFVQWVSACAWEMAKEGKTRRQAMHRCDIDFHLGEPHTGVVEAEDKE